MSQGCGIAPRQSTWLSRFTLSWSSNKASLGTRGPLEVGVHSLSSLPGGGHS